MRLIPSHHGKSLSMESGDTVHESSTQFLMLMSEICGSLPQCHLTTYWYFAVFSTCMGR